MTISLSPAERRKFSIYLDQEVETNKGLIEQLGKLGPGQEAMIGIMKSRALAYAIVSKDLKSVEELTIQ